MCLTLYMKYMKCQELNTEVVVAQSHFRYRVRIMGLMRVGGLTRHINL